MAFKKESKNYKFSFVKIKQFAKIMFLQLCWFLHYACLWEIFVLQKIVIVKLWTAYFAFTDSCMVYS